MGRPPRRGAVDEAVQSGFTVDTKAARSLIRVLSQARPVAESVLDVVAHARPPFSSTRAVTESARGLIRALEGACSWT